MKYINLVLTIFISIICEAQIRSLNSADSLYATGNYIKAINEYAKDGSPKAALQIGRSYNAIGNFDKAITQYESLLSEHPELEIAKFELSKLYLKVKKYDLAKKLLIELIDTNPNNPEYFYVLGESFRENSLLDKSITNYKRAIQVDSTHLRSLFQLAKYYLVKREKDSVLHYSNMGLDFYPEDVALINLKALAYFNNDNFGSSVPYFEKLIELGEHKPFVYQKLGYAYFKTWEFEKAKKMYTSAIMMDSENPELYYELGHVFLKDRALDSAQVYFNQAIKIKKPYLAKEYESLAGVYRIQENLKEALHYYQLAHQEEPRNPTYYYQVCALNDQLSDNPEKKLEYYENFKKMYGKNRPYISEMVAKRISELKSEIHFSKN